MSAIACVVCLSSLLSFGSALFDSAHPARLQVPESTPAINNTDSESAHLPLNLYLLNSTHDDVKAPIVFPKKTDVSTPILKGDDPRLANLPPKYFPTRALEHSTEVAKHDDSTVSVNKTAATGEANDMLHSTYTGGQDVDEILKPQEKATEKKATEKSEKKVTEEKKPPSPKSQVVVNASMDNDGPKLMNSSSGASIINGVTKVMAESSSMFSQQTTHERHRATLGPARAVASILLSAAAFLCLAVIGLMVWKKITMRKFGRDILINEEDFDDTSDMHTFDRAQIHIS